jgi:inorganic triphosphatase YgiF
VSIITAPMRAVSRSAVPLVKPVGRELELKFLVGGPDAKGAGWPMLPRNNPKRAARLRSFYYDTAQGDLHRHKMSLRMRAQRRGFVMTLKYDGGFPGGLFERGEIEVFSAAKAPDPDLLGPEFSAAIEAATEGRPLGLAYETDIRRITHVMSSESSEIELAFDTGFIIAGGRRLPVREIEMELKSGNPEDLYRLGIQLAENFSVRLGMQAKSERGFLLLTETAPAAVRAGPVLAGTPSVDEAISALLGDCLTQFTANWPAFYAGDAVNAVHQMRVAMRRLRALLGMFQRSFPCADFVGFREDAKRIAGAMGDARNLDVFLALLRDGPMKAFAYEAGFADIVEECGVLRAAGYAQVRALLEAPETTRFVLSLQGFVARRGWRNALGAEALAHLTAPARVFGAAHIARLHQKILKRGRKRLALNAHDRHELRIDLKKLRYAADGFGALFEAGKQVRAYTRNAARLQDALGAFNDLVTAHALVEGLAAAQTRAAGIVVGWCGRAAVGDDEVLLETWKSFRKAGVPG